MPRYTTNLHALDKDIEALAAKLKKDPQNGPPKLDEEPSAAAAPIIIEEPAYLGRMGVTVIWDGWREFSGGVRGRVILDSSQRALGEEVARTIGVAMGFTWDQYDRMPAEAG